MMKYLEYKQQGVKKNRHKEIHLRKMVQGEEQDPIVEEEDVKLQDPTGQGSNKR